jgi:hypothetical protein
MQRGELFSLYQILLEAAEEASLLNLIKELHLRNRFLIFFEVLIVAFYFTLTVAVIKRLPYPLEYFRDEVLYISLGFLIFTVVAYFGVLRISYSFLKRELSGGEFKGLETFFRENLQDIRYLIFKRRLIALLSERRYSISPELLERIEAVFDEDLAIELEKRNWLFQHPALTTAVAFLIAIVGGWASIKDFWNGWVLPLTVAVDLFFIGVSIFVLDFFRPTWVKMLEVRRFLNWLKIDLDGYGGR